MKLFEKIKAIRHFRVKKYAVLENRKLAFKEAVQTELKRSDLKIFYFVFELIPYFFF